VPEADGAVHRLEDRIEMMPYELEAIREEAFRKGEVSGEQRALSVYESELLERLKECDALLSNLEETKDALIKEMHGAVGHLVVEAAGRLLEGWQPEETDVVRIVEGLLEDFDSGEHRMRIRLNPQSLELLSDRVIGVLAQSHPNLELVSDARLKPGESLLEGRFGLADARYSEKLKNLNEVLTYE